MTPITQFRILVDSWYTTLFPECDSLENEIRRRFGERWARLARFSTVRGMLGWWIARDYDFVTVINGWPGCRWLMFLTAWLGGARRRKFILLEFISCPERRLNQLVFSVWMPLIFRPTIRRVMTAAQVMCAVEPEYYSRLFGLPASLFHLVPLPLMQDTPEERTYTASDNLVFASARGLSDWETLFRAAQGANWRLHVVCPDRDRKMIDRLNKDGLATVQSAVPPSEHARIMASAAVYALPLTERPVSCGQLRVRDAITAGTPIVCSRVVGLEGYAIPDQTASVVEVGDHVALRREIDRLLSDPEWRRTLAMRAREAACGRTKACFTKAIREFVYGVATEAMGEATSA